MSWSDELQTIAGEVMTSPKTTAAVAGTSATLGAAGAMDIIHGTFALLAIAASVVATLALARFHMAGEKNERLKNKLLKKQLADLGIDPEAE